MSYSLQLYSVDIRKVAAVVGGRDASLVPKIRKSQRKLWWSCEDIEPEEGELTAEDALRMIIDGTATDEHGVDACRALELICGHFGEHIPMAGFEDIHFNFLNEVAVVGELLKTPLPFPFPKGDLGCRVGFLSNQRLVEIGDTLLDDVPPHRNTEVNACRIEYSEVLESIAEEGNDVVAFSQ